MTTVVAPTAHADVVETSSRNPPHHDARGRVEDPDLVRKYFQPVFLIGNLFGGLIRGVGLLLLRF